MARPSKCLQINTSQKLAKVTLCKHYVPDKLDHVRLHFTVNGFTANCQYNCMLWLKNSCKRLRYILQTKKIILMPFEVYCPVTVKSVTNGAFEIQNFKFKSNSFAKTKFKPRKKCQVKK